MTKKIIPRNKKRIRTKLSVGIFFVFLLTVLVGYVVFDVPTRLNKEIISPIPQLLYSNNPHDIIKESLIKAQVPFETIYVASGSSYVVKQEEGQEIFLTSKKDIRTQVATLQLILSRLTIEGKSLSRLDLRYDKPIVVLK